MRKARAAMPPMPDGARLDRGSPVSPDQAEREVYIQHVFDAIAERYDGMNLLMTLGMLRYWQRVFRRHTGLKPGGQALDVACGTAELALIMARQVGPSGHVWGVDISPEMVRVGQRKVERAGLAGRITLQAGNALDLPFEDGSFDCVATGFALRNVANIPQALREMARVTRPGGRVVCLELSHPPSWWVRYPFQLYFRHVVPWLGRWSERRFRYSEGLTPYRWLPESLRGFPDQRRLAEHFREAGLAPVYYRNLSGGIVCLHVGIKPGSPDGR